MGRTPGVKNGEGKKAQAAAASAPIKSSSMTPQPVRAQIKNLAGMSKEELAASVPESTAVSLDEAKPKRRSKATVETDPMMDDPRYKKAIGNMTAFGGKRIIKSGFQAAALVMDSPDVGLNKEEEENWDDYFYVVSKKSNIDPTRPWLLALTGVMMLLENIIVRVWKNGSDSFSKQLGEFFGFLKKEEEPTKEEGKAATA